MNIVSRAIKFATDAHDGQSRKASETPAIMHSLEAACIVATLTGDKEVIAAAILHDTVEDTGITIDDIKEQFGERVARLVASETENKRRNLAQADTWPIRKKEAIEELQNSKDIAVKIVFLGDKLSNMRSFYRLKLREGDDMWRFFSQKDPEMHHWYYRTIADAMPELWETVAFAEYDRLIKEVFEK